MAARRTEEADLVKVSIPLGASDNAQVSMMLEEKLNLSDAAHSVEG